MRSSLDILTFQPAMESIENFVRVMAPSTTPSTLGPWLNVYNGLTPTPPRLSDEQMQRYTTLIEACRQGCTERPREKNKCRTQCRDELLQAAAENRDVVGKWIIFPFAHRVDRAWADVARATWDGELTHHAKVATTNRERPQRLYPICIYVRDWRDREEVERVLRQLQRMGWVKRSKEDPDEKRMDAFFKPDVFTRLGAYHHAGEGREQEVLRIDPVLYRVDDFAL